MSTGARIETGATLLSWALERDGHLLVAQQPDGASRGLGILSYDLSAPKRST